MEENCKEIEIHKTKTLIKFLYTLLYIKIYLTSNTSLCDGTEMYKSNDNM